MTGKSATTNCSNAPEPIDATEEVYSVELRMLRKIFETSSDLCKGYDWEGFRDACGGIEALKAAHFKAVLTLEEWYNDADDSCR